MWSRRGKEASPTPSLIISRNRRPVQSISFLATLPVISRFATFLKLARFHCAPFSLAREKVETICTVESLATHSAMSLEKESSQERFPHHAYGQSSSSSPSSTETATFTHNEYPRNGEPSPSIDGQPQRRATPPWYQEHGTFSNISSRLCRLVEINRLSADCEIGAPIDQDPIKHEENELDFENHHQKYLWSRIRHSIRDPLAEFLGCFILIIFGDGSVAQVVLSSNPDLPKGSQNKGAYQSISWG